MSDVYELILRADDSYAGSLPRAPVRDRLRAIPKLRALGEDRFEFGEPDEHGVMQLRLSSLQDGRELQPAELGDPSSATMNAVHATIPRPWVMERGPQVFAIVFMVQGWTDWTVYDPQIQSTLEREVVLQGLVAMRQARLSAEEEGRVPTPELRPAPPASSASGAPDFQPRSTRAAAPVSHKKRSRWRFW